MQTSDLKYLYPSIISFHILVFHIDVETVLDEVRMKLIDLPNNSDLKNLRMWTFKSFVKLTRFFENFQLLVTHGLIAERRE